MPEAGLEDLWLAACLLGALPYLYRGCRIHYFEHPARSRAFQEWVERSYPDVWARLPTLERKYLNPQLGIARIRRHRWIVDPEFEQRWQAVRRHESSALRPMLAAGVLVLLGLAPKLVRDLSL